MYPAINKILFTSDLTETSRHAFQYASLFASRLCAKLIFLHVMEDVPMSAKAFLDEEMVHKIRNKLRQTAQRKLIGKRTDITMLESELNRFCESAFDESVDQKAVDTDVIVLEGNVIETIISTAEKMACDAIVMGSPRKSFIAETMRGSVVKGVLRQTTKLVILVPPK